MSNGNCVVGLCFIVVLNLVRRMLLFQSSFRKKFNKSSSLMAPMNADQAYSSGKLSSVADSHLIVVYLWTHLLKIQVKGCALNAIILRLSG